VSMFQSVPNARAHRTKFDRVLQRPIDTVYVSAAVELNILPP